MPICHSSVSIARLAVVEVPDLSEHSSIIGVQAITEEVQAFLD